MLATQHLRAALCRKFLSLTQNEHAQAPELDSAFRTAIITTVEEIRTSCWKAVFHSGLPSLYNVIASLSYIMIFQRPSEGFDPRLLVLILGVVVIVWYATRTKRGSAIAKKEFILSRKAEEQLDGMLTSWLRVQESERTLGVTDTVFDAFWRQLREGMYVMWYHRMPRKPPAPPAHPRSRRVRADALQLTEPLLSPDADV